jgi:AraC-like DNA-binding protein
MLHEFFAPAIDVSFPSAVDGSVSGRIEAWQLGSILVVYGESPDVVLNRSARQVGRDDLDHWMLRVLRSGELLSRSGDGVYRQRRGDVVLDTMTEDFADRWTQSDWISLVIPREGFESLEAVNRGAGPLKGPAARILGDFAVSLVRQLREAAPEDAGALTEITLSMIRSSLLRRTTRDEITQMDATRFQRESTRAIIRQNIGSPRLSPERLCEMTGLSRSALYRLFEAHGGIARYIQEQRLSLVMQDLRDHPSANRPISAIAEARGFHNASAFSRAFRQRFGCTPREVRHAALMGAHLVTDDHRKSGRFVQLLG